MATPVEQWLVNKAKNAESKSVAESWVLVAKTMSAGSYEMNGAKLQERRILHAQFVRLFELFSPSLDAYFQSATYQIHCAKENVNDSARCLEKLYVRYGSDKRFWLEIDLIMEAFHTRNLDSTARFRQAVFKALLPDLQLCLLLELAAKCKSLASKNKCFVLSLRMFPEKLNTFGLEFLQILQDLASQEQSSENVYQQYLVCEVGPSLLRCQQLPLKEDICIELIHQILQFLLLLNNIPSPNHSSVLDPILMEKVALARSEKWNFLLSQIHLVAERLKWKDTMELTQLSMETIQKFLTKFPSDINGNAEWNILSMVIFCWAAVTYKGCYDQFFDGDSRRAAKKIVNRGPQIVPITRVRARSPNMVWTQDGQQLYSPTLNMGWQGQTQVQSQRETGKRKTQPRKPKDKLAIRAEGDITPPTYSVIESKRHRGSLYAPGLRVYWPDRPAEGYYSKEFHLNSKRHPLQKPKIPHLTLNEPDRSAMVPETKTKTIGMEVYRPQGPLCNLGSQYLGVMSKTEAQYKCVDTTRFLLYHAIPDKTNATTNIELPLTVVYRTCLGDYRHYRVLTQMSRPFQYRAPQVNYYVNCGILKKPTFSSIEAMVKHHSLYGYVVPAAYGRSEVDVEIFPWWLDDQIEETEIEQK